MKTRFFPKNRLFWLYNGSAFSLLFVCNMAIRILSGDPFWFNLGGTLLWVSLIASTGLVFRWQYHRKQWSKRSVQGLLPQTTLLALCSSLAVGLLMGLCVLGYVLGFETQHLANASASSIFMISAFTNTVPSLFIILIWCFAYLGITANRRERQAQLKQLQTQHSLQEAQLNTLISQINPHFLFNTLNNLRFMIHKDTQQADTTLVYLSEILRYSLDIKQSEKMTVQAEIDIVKKYIALMALQLGEKIQFTCELNPSLKHYLIPPMLIQMLVENAVKHGIYSCETGGDIRVHLEKRVPQYLALSVENSLKNSTDVNFNRDQGIGLDNIRRRLALLYNHKASFDIAVKSQRVVASVLLPLEPVQ